MATPKGSKPAAGKPNDIDALIAKGKSNYSESIDAKNKSTFDYDDGKYPQFWNSFNIQEGANGWGVLTVWLFLDEPYKDKLYYQWYSIMSNREGEEGLFDSRLLEFLEKVTGTKAEDLDFGSRDELEAILKDAWKQDQVWSAQFSTRKGKDRNGDDTEFKNWKLLKKLDDYVLPKKGKAKPGAAASKAKKKNECPFEVDDDVTIEQGEGTVVSIDEENETANVKVGKKTHKDIAWDDITPVDDDDDEDEDEDEATYEEGQTVRFNVTEGKGKNKTTTEHEGVVTEVDEENETLTVKVGKGKNAETYEVEFSDVLEDEDEDEDEDDDDQVLDSNDNPIEVGDTVKWSVTTGKGSKKTTEEFEGPVLEIADDEDHTLTVKVGEEGKGKAKKDVTEEVAASEVEVQSEDDEDEDEDDDEGSAYEEGQTVAFTIPADKKKKREEFSGEGVITEVDDENETLTVKVGKGKSAKDYEVEFDWVDTDEDDDADEDGDDDEEGGDELVPGKTKVEYKHPKSKKAARGTIVSVDDKANTCKVKTGAQTIEISQDDIAFILTGADNE